MTSTSPLPNDLPVLDADPFSNEVLTHPYAFFEELRECGPVGFLSRYGIYASGRYEQCQKILSTWQAFTNSGGAGMADIRKPGAWRPPSVILEVDPPEHTKVRGALMKILSPVVIRGWREKFEAEAELQAQRLLEMREFDGVRDVAEAFVLKVFPAAVGVDVPRDNAIAIGDMNFNAIGPANDRFQRSLEAAKPYMDWYERSMTRDAMKPGGFGELLFKAEDAGEFATGVAANLARSFLRGGMDTTISGIGWLLKVLAERPHAWAALRDDPTRIRNAFDEAIRFESPVQVMFRTVTVDTDLFGVELKADTKIAAFIGAANRDPRQFDQADVYVPERKVSGHLAFGAGVHVCIGQMIARMEAESIVGALLKRVQKIELAGEPELRLVNTVRTQTRLPLRAVPA